MLLIAVSYGRRGRNLWTKLDTAINSSANHAWRRIQIQDSVALARNFTRPASENSTKEPNFLIPNSTRRRHGMRCWRARVWSARRWWVGGGSVAAVAGVKDRAVGGGIQSWREILISRRHVTQLFLSLRSVQSAAASAAAVTAAPIYYFFQ